MYQSFQKNKKILFGIALCLLIAGITMSFQNTPFGPIDKLDSFTDLQDTIPSENKKEEGKMNIKDFDLLMQNFNNEMVKMQKENAKIDFDKMHREITASLDKVDLDNVKSAIDKAMKEIDVAKLEQCMKIAMKEIDWNKINNDVKASLLDAKKEIEKIDMQAVEQAMKQAKIEIEKSKKEIKNINIDEIMKNANASITKARDDLRLTKDMFNEMEKDGLINQKEGFTIEYKDKTLIINGKKQSESVSHKYQQYIKGDPYKISISKEKE